MSVYQIGKEPDQLTHATNLIEKTLLFKEILEKYELNEGSGQRTNHEQGGVGT
jgi:hypothetical protein